MCAALHRANTVFAVRKTFGQTRARARASPPTRSGLIRRAAPFLERHAERKLCAVVFANRSCKDCASERASKQSVCLRVCLRNRQPRAIKLNRTEPNRTKASERALASSVMSFRAAEAKSRPALLNGASAMNEWDRLRRAIILLACDRGARNHNNNNDNNKWPKRAVASSRA